MSHAPPEPMKMACVFCNGELGDPTYAKRYATGADLLIAADGGAKHLAALGRQPRAVVGDMDSMDPLLWQGDRDVLHLSYPPDKDESDTELAVEYAFEQGCGQVFLLAAAGGRLDHTLGNVSLVARFPGRVAMLDGRSMLVALDSSYKCALRGEIGAVVSLIPYGPSGVRVRTKGLKYSLDNEPLKFATHGISNEMVQPEACVSVAEGMLLVCIERGEAWPKA